ncbi:2'-5' RNA ligase superfamily protein [Klenkia soli]|uniref:2'-5' RNA ligase superfamily protein n=1 Tax=Klenkia soli TaxID=1052260 RepID=A0A1H0C5V9_9ACTN|nr:2'-5' RNA ligase family protein [Klenkia soli]SDN53241.1 2'-5' RNA ligase superfamily protein [Klenkia soli]
MTQPLVVTLLLADGAQQRFDALRDRHFPADRNHLQAHVTLFHAVPGEHLAAVRDDLGTAADRPGFEVEVSGVRSLGGGVAFDLHSDDVTDLRTALARAWAPWLTRQDAQWKHPHVTVQNKVAPAAARALHADLAAGFTPYAVPSVGLGLWRYEGGPWSPVARYAFG